MPQTAQRRKQTVLLSLVAGVALLCVKFIAYGLTGSSAIFSDALESIVNVVASGFAVYAIHLSDLPADREHPYGHGKIEFLSAAFEGGMIVIAALVILWQAIDTILHPPIYQSLAIGMALMVVALLVNGGVGLYLVRVGRQQDSLAIEADGQHLISDAATSVMALVALALIKLMNWHYADPICAITIAVYISFTGMRLIKRAAAGLMDEQDESDRQMLEGILNRHMGPNAADPKICSYHKLRHRHSGRYHWVDFHIMVPAEWSIERGHQVASAIEYEIEQSLKYANATAHIEPCDDDACADCGNKIAYKE